MASRGAGPLHRLVVMALWVRLRGLPSFPVSIKTSTVYMTTLEEEENEKVEEEASKDETAIQVDMSPLPVLIYCV
ncbi:hypothetical protein R6Q59_025912 [Mikania micrantha]